MSENRSLETTARLNGSLVQALIEGGDGMGLRQTLQVLLDLVDGQVGYVVFLTGSHVIQADCQGQIDGQLFQIGSDALSVDLPEEARLQNHPLNSLFGNLELSASLQIPLVLGGELVGLIELGRRAGPLNSADCTRLLDNEAFLQSTFGHLQRQIRKNAEFRRLRMELERQYRLVSIFLEATHDLVLTMAVDGHILEINQAGRRLLGLEDGEVLDRLPLENPSMEVVINILESRGAVSDFEAILRRRDGGVRFCLASFVPDFDGRNRVCQVQAMFKDISDRIETQRQLWHANLELEAANQALRHARTQQPAGEALPVLGRLAEGIVPSLGKLTEWQSELGDKYGLLLGYIQGLEARLGNGAELRDQAGMTDLFRSLPGLLDRGRDRSGQLGSVVAGLRSLSEPAGDKAANLVDIDQVILDSLELARPVWESVAEVETVLHLGREIEGQGRLLGDVITNLLVNAAQAIVSRPERLPGRIVIRSGLAGGQALIEIEDDGPGVNPDWRERIFEPFFSTRPVGEGLGLGLSIAYDIVVRQHRGSLELRTPTGGGACFMVFLPLLQGQGATDVQSLDSGA